MAAILPLIATRVRRFFNTSFKQANGVSQLMTIDDGNKIIDIVNVLAANANKTVTNQFTVQDPGGVVPTLRQNGGGVYVCQGRCPYATVEFQQAFCCGASYYYDSVYVKTGAFETSGTGRYTLTIQPFINQEGININWNDLTVQVGNPKVPGIITVEKVSLNQYIISTYNLAGVLANGILDQAVITVTGYIPFIEGGWQDLPAIPKN